MKSFNKYFSGLLYGRGVELVESDDGLLGLSYLQISLFFGQKDARVIINNKENKDNIDDLNNIYHKNDNFFQLFIVTRLGIGSEVDIKKSNLYLKNAVEAGEIGALLYKSLVEEVRNNDDGVNEYLGNGGDSKLLKTRAMDFNGEEDDYSKIYPKHIHELTSDIFD